MQRITGSFEGLSGAGAEIIRVLQGLLLICGSLFFSAAKRSGGSTLSVRAAILQDCPFPDPPK